MLPWYHHDTCNENKNGIESLETHLQNTGRKFTSPYQAEAYKGTTRFRFMF